MSFLGWAAGLSGLGAVVFLYWPQHHSFSLFTIFATMAVVLNWLRMKRSGAEAKVFKSAMLVFAMVAALIPGEMLYCRLKPESCGVEGLSTYVMYFVLPPLLLVTLLIGAFDKPSPAEDR